jgi:hypothetical protein
MMDMSIILTIAAIYGAAGIVAGLAYRFGTEDRPGFNERTPLS